jgi:hypothetical protein
MKYAQIDDFIIVAARDENGELIGFHVCDKNMEKASPKLFSCASDAILWADENFRGLLDDTPAN